MISAAISLANDRARAHRGERPCLHCNTRLAASANGEFCCTGCEIVHGLLVSGKLEHYYDLRNGKASPVANARNDRRDLKWLEDIDARRIATGGATSIDLDIQGIQCTACVWLIETLFGRRRGARSIVVNPALGRAHLIINADFELAPFVREAERFGYLFGKPLKQAELRPSRIVTRMGICIAIAMNVMILGIASYAGLQSGPTYLLFQRTSLGLGLLSVVVGGSVFFRSAWEGVRRGILHLDLPISIGIVFAFVGSTASYASDRPRGVFIDTLSVFIALMLVGRFLQERVLEKNRLALLSSDGVDGLLTRRVRGGRIDTIACTEIRSGDCLLVAASDLVPIDGVLDSPEENGFSLDWINGESRSRIYRRGETIPAGAFSASGTAATLIASTDFDASPLPDLLRTPASRGTDFAMSLPWWRHVAKTYVAFVLAAAAIGFIGWMMRTHDLARSLEVTTAILIVTCPCAFGIAMPLAYDLAQSALRRSGLYVRSAGFLDRAARVRTVVFDKTGTLTIGQLEVCEPDALRVLSPEWRKILLSLAASSAHPKSRAIARVFAGELTCVDSRVVEHPGLGMSLKDGENEWRLGVGSLAASNEDVGGDVAFSKNGALLADIFTSESLRSDAVDEVRSLRNAGYDVWLLSGDDFARTAQTARVVGIDADHAVGGQSAESKGRWIAAHDREDLLMVGDGINDSLAVSNAFCSGTPAIDRPFMAARTDFYFTTPGLAPIREALQISKQVATVRKRNLAIALSYNVLAVALCYAGFMSPLVCAVLMPTVSLVTILATVVALSPQNLDATRSLGWKP
ncbi:MAG: heavy metal translocating P-type ATPase metal-binding domain-containing protein [Polyangiaceae bacterium]